MDVSGCARLECGEQVVLEVGPELAVQGTQLVMLRQQHATQRLAGVDGLEAGRTMGRAAVAQRAGKGEMPPGLVPRKKRFADVAQVGRPFREVPTVGPGAQPASDARI